MSDKIYEQILQVRSSGKCNMIDTTAVQRYAHEHDFHELVIFIEEHKKEYVEFIIYGKRD